MTCKNCGSHTIETGLKIGLSNETGHVGFKHGSFFFNTIPILCDLCLDCGEVVRLYVNENDLKNKKWIKK